MSSEMFKLMSHEEARIDRNERLSQGQEISGLYGMPDRGRRRLNLGKASTVDSILLGRDLDQSGEDPHKDFMAKYHTHAGKPSGHRTAQQDLPQPAKKYGLSQCSQMDDLIYGHDIDVSGRDPHEEFMSRFGDYAGTRSKEDKATPFRKPGMAHASDMDEILYGRDLDQSGVDPHAAFFEKYGEYAGKKSADQGDLPPRRGRGKPVNASMENIIAGTEQETSRNQFIAQAKQRYEGYAGMATKNKDRKPIFLSKVNNAQVTVMEKVIYCRPNENNDFEKAAKEEFLAKYEGYAGATHKKKHYTKPAATAPAETEAAAPQEEEPEQRVEFKPPSRTSPNSTPPASDRPPAGSPKPPSRTSPAATPPASDLSPADSPVAMQVTMKPRATLAIDVESQGEPDLLTPNPVLDVNSIVPQRVNPFGNGTRSPQLTGSQLGSRTPSVCGSVCSDSKPRWR
eukprot:TRINITY_DN18424_c0_g2_i1.p1 TRINITY_DN18424_c0_g2~~TRINITY_DN18424_c0_g2_i1.p1  ORF type:complete len:454 (+),score=82.56 TRINITY_DN18424_c0_g2_i1:181-1542(+)